MNTSWPQTIRLILFSALLGGAAGILTTALTTNYLADYALELGQLTEPLRLSEQRPIAFPSSYEEALGRIEQEALPAVVSLTAESATPESLFGTEDQVAVTITSDGWMMALGNEGYTDVFTRSEFCNVTDRVVDAMTGVYFYHCETQSLPVVGFGSGFAVEQGEQLFIVGSQGSVVRGQASLVEWSQDVPASSDIPSRRVILSTNSGAEIGDLVFDLSGKLVGIIEDERADGQLAMLPLEAILPALNRLLESGEITRPALNAQVIHLSTAIVSDELSRGRTHGALLYGSRAAVFGGVVSGAGLESGDIILSVDYQTITATTTLDELLLAYQAGDEVTLVFDRLGDEMEVDVTLGEGGY